MLTLSLVVRKLSLIAISLICFGNEKICTSITGWGNQTIRDLIQFATFSTRFVPSLQKRDFTRSMTVYSETGLET